ncbi:hypothetical protein L3X38_004481 [Prunus dulcis]|uniref:Uncharacterized protein n=1 Tax=Prunus dulcis TaxID=3755 RepID=A0AAD5F3A7_PRUDU|nr:hypothetical protein L3X38_004481 [Prunus dulcis]
MQSPGFYKYENLNKFIESLGQAEQAPEYSSSSVIINLATSVLSSLKRPQFCSFNKPSMAQNKLKLCQTQTMVLISSRNSSVKGVDDSIQYGPIQSSPV